MSTVDDPLDHPFGITIAIDRSSPSPLHLQVSEPITEMILSGKLAPGQLLEDEVTLAKRLHVSRPTVRRAFQDMVNAGLLSRRRGVGTRVTLPHIHRRIALSSLYEDLLHEGRNPRTDVLSYEVKLADSSIARSLQCDEGEEVVRVERLRWSDEQPLALMMNIIPAHSAPTLTELTRAGLYQGMGERGVKPVSAIQTVGARIASGREAQLLQLDEGSALVTAERTAFTEDGHIVDFGRHIYDATRYQVTFTLLSE